MNLSTLKPRFAGPSGPTGPTGPTGEGATGPTGPAANAAGSIYEIFEHFCGSSSYAGNIGASNAGGSTANTAAYAKLGVLAIQTGATASTDQRGCVATSSSAFQLKNGVAYYLNMSMGQLGSNWFVGGAGDNGAARWGMTNTTAPVSSGSPLAPVEPTQGVYFRAKNSQTVEFVTIAGGVETATTCSISGSPVVLSTGTLHTYEIIIASDGSSAVAKINGTTVATHTTNIPSSAVRLNVLLHVIRSTASANSYGIAADWLYFKATPTTPFFS